MHRVEKGKVFSIVKLSLVISTTFEFSRKKTRIKIFWKFLDAGIQDVSTSISIVHDLIEMSYGDAGDESDKHV